MQGSDGNFYGATLGGGTAEDGTVFSITPAGVLTTLHTFTGADGAYPEAALVQGSDGNFYGTTLGDGSTSYGSVFSITPAGVFTTLHSFSTPDSSGINSDGQLPQSALVQDSNGNFYGTASSGGTSGEGTIFSITPAGIFATLHSFSATDSNGMNSDGAVPQTGLVRGSDGNFYGTTAFGGTSGGTGVFFRLSFVPAVGTVQFAAASVNTTENAGSVVVTVSRVGGSAGAISVNYATADGTALAGTDYTATSGTVSWADGDTADKQIGVFITDRQLYDGSTKTFSVVLSAPTGGATLGTTSSASVNILDNDQAPQPTATIVSLPPVSTAISATTTTVVASINDPGNLTTAVTLLVNGLAKGSTTAPPYVFPYTASTVGTDTLTIAVTDNLGRTSTSPAVTVNVIAATPTVPPPTSALLTPVGGYSLAAGSTVTLNIGAAASSTTALDHVGLYADGVLVTTFNPDGSTQATPGRGQPTRRDATAAVSNVFQTTYTLPVTDKLINMIAVAFDKLGQSTVTPVATIHSKVTTTAAPLVSLASVNGGAHVQVGSANTVSVSASEPAATAAAIGNVSAAGLVRQDAMSSPSLALLEYYINGIKLAQAIQPPFSFSFTPPDAGKYVLSAVATDSTGLATVSEPVIVVADPVPPTVNLAVSGASAVMEGGAKGVVVISRIGDTTSPLTITYKAKGTAQADVDYKKLPGTITIPAGATKAKIKVKPLAGLTGAGTLQLKLVLVAPSDGSYVVGTGTVKLKLIGND